jgi:UMF1 family MFS transporter
MGVAGFMVAIAAPVLGAMADQHERRMPWIMFFTLLCCVATASLWFVMPSTEFVLPALVLVALATIGSELALVFYNSLLPRLAPPKEIGRWSGWSWGIGYAGGLLCLAIVLFIFIRSGGAPLGLDTAAAEHVRATALFVAAWYLLFAVPLFVFVPDLPGHGKTAAQSVRDGLAQLWETLRTVRRYKTLVRFLVARMFYIDGLATLFAFGGIYAAGTFGMSVETVLAFGIAMNVASGLGAFAFGWIDDWLGSRTTILVSLVGLLIPGIAVLLVESQTLFWIFALALGLFVGPVQAASRSLLAHMAPRDLQNQMFGFFALSGKATAFVGPLMVGWVTYWFSSQRVGMATIIVFFAVGLAILRTLPPQETLALQADRA